MSENTGPLPGAAHPAGWVSPESAAHAARVAIAWELAQEQEAAAKAAREQAISERIARMHVPAAAPGPAPVEGNRAVVDGGKDDGKRF